MTTSLVVYDRPGDLSRVLEAAGFKLTTADFVLDEFSCRVFTWHPPAAPKLQQLLEQAAVIAAREDSKAGAHIRRALEACVDVGTWIPTERKVPTGSEVKRAVLENPHLTDEQKARMEACDRAVMKARTCSDD